MSAQQKGSSKMVIPYSAVITSPTFDFLVGPYKKKFTLHSAAVEQVSKPLASLMKGSMREAEEMVAWLKEDDEETFARFAQYVYMYDYTNPKPSDERDQNDEDTSVEEVANSDAPGIDFRASSSSGISRPTGGSANGGDSGVGHKNNRSNNADVTWKPRRRLRGSKAYRPGSWAGFIHETYLFERPYEPEKIRFNPKKRYMHVFLCHARVYVFADKYGIDSLKSLALQKLHNTLCVFRIRKMNVADLAELLRYSYIHTRDSPDEPLRALLMEYVACKDEQLDASTDFGTLLLTDDTPRELPWEIVRAMTKRLRGISSVNK